MFTFPKLWGDDLLVISSLLQMRLWFGSSLSRGICPATSFPLVPPLLSWRRFTAEAISFSSCEAGKSATSSIFAKKCSSFGVDIESIAGSLEYSYLEGSISEPVGFNLFGK